ncbi:MAG: hypothetical protein O2992_03470 [Gemmatimonadetes bacterium]|jgi:hypothetical protein|nr:hypothetical protein [Gemmatimonadota bacterium]
MRILTPLLVVLLLGGAPGPASGQSVVELLQSVRQGGGWVRIPIEGGQGMLLTSAIPTLGLTLVGCMQVYPGHSGRWDITARDPLGDGLLEASVPGGEPVTFRYQTGQRAQLSVDVRWSEPRDTTLLLWVGLETPGQEGDSCAPVFGSGS